MQNPEPLFLSVSLCPRGRGVFSSPTSTETTIRHLISLYQFQLLIQVKKHQLQIPTKFQPS
ncbi:hypothetical protein glysoja_031619 [Glycine soja]|uniref:Uncharacterized protein n=1 Tax=Glycine soja TaxID=3848 RepID=A0A0B2PF28_GLYSO|nr:hypothetical protein glysoja_031619 [Glycine soja]